MAAVALNSGSLFDNFLAGFLSRWNGYKAQRSMRRQLTALSERQLEDIGMNRADVDDITGA